MFQRSAFLALMVIALQLAGCRDEEIFPNRPITLICPWSPGGGTDRVSREVAALLEDELDVPVNVINATGGAGVTGHTRGALAKPDGYTLMMITVELNMLHHRGLTNISYEDFEPLVLLNRDDAAIFVGVDSPWRSLADLESAVRARPHGLKASGTAQGGIWHIAVAGWLEAIGMHPDDAIWVSINGAGPSLQELLSGGIDFVCCSLPEAITLVEAGQIRCLGVMAPKRLDSFPDVPTFREQGVNWEMWGWRGLALPMGVSTERKEILLAAVERAIERSEYRKFMRNNRFDARAAGPREFSAELTRLDREFGEILTSDAYRGVRDARYGAMLFPAVIGVALVLVLALLFWTRGQAHRDTLLEATVESLDPAVFGQSEQRVHNAGTRSDSRATRGAVMPVMVAVASVILFVAAMEWLGFVPTSFLFMAFFMRYLGTRLTVALAVSAAVACLTYHLFTRLGATLPWGLLGW